MPLQQAFCLLRCSHSSKLYLYIASRLYYLIWNNQTCRQTKCLFSEHYSSGSEGLQQVVSHLGSQLCLRVHSMGLQHLGSSCRIHGLKHPIPSGISEQAWTLNYGENVTILTYLIQAGSCFTFHVLPTYFRMWCSFVSSVFLFVRTYTNSTNKWYHDIYLGNGDKTNIRIHLQPRR